MLLKNYSFLLFISLALWVDLKIAFCQSSLPSEKDPKAKAALDLMKKRYEGYTSFDLSFSVVIELPNLSKKLQQGQFIRKGSKYKFVMDQQTVLCDGKTLWVILKNEKEVQINDLPSPDEELNILSPEALFSLYKRKDLSYSLQKEYVEKGRFLQNIIFKTLDKTADYSKLELVLDKKSGEIISFKAFAKDGSRFLFQFSPTKANPSFPDTFFQFRKSEYPGFYVEDLRA